MTEDLLMDTSDENPQHRFLLPLEDFALLTEKTIAENAVAGFRYNPSLSLYPEKLKIDEGLFPCPDVLGRPHWVTVIQIGELLSLCCDCDEQENKLCTHQAQTLTAIIKKDEFAIFFNQRGRRTRLEKAAIDFGLEKEVNLDDYFHIELSYMGLVITPKLKGLLPVTKQKLDELKNEIISLSPKAALQDEQHSHNGNFVVFKQHKYYPYLQVALHSAATTKDGKIKNPVSPIDPFELVWQTAHPDELKFFTAIASFQNNSSSKLSATELTALQAIIKNPLGYPCYYHNSKTSDNITASALERVKTAVLPDTMVLTITQNDPFYKISGSIKIDGIIYTINDLPLKATCFLQLADTLYLVDKAPLLAIVELLKRSPGTLLVHTSKFKQFRTSFLESIEGKIKIEYQYIQQATHTQLAENGFDKVPQKLIYLSAAGNHIELIPVMRYRDVEIEVRDKRQIYAMDEAGKEFLVKRNDELEIAFIALLTRQHPDFEEQLDNDHTHFYLHKQEFLNEDWFPGAFETWRQQGITILGFNELPGNKLNPHKVSISIKVVSGINWFNTIVDVRFGKKKASLKKLLLAVRNKSKYVQLDDGTLGILPADWIEKFEGYFNAGEITDDNTIQTSKINFAEIERLYEAEMLDVAAKHELADYKQRFADFSKIEEVAPPAGLNGTLRTYQQQGLNWLNFLDQFNFGGCLADDMGLGKSLQIIAFILLQRNKKVKNTNLLVAPVTLLFNWKAEIEKFAPSVTVLILQGPARIKHTKDFDNYEVILTSYNTLLADISFIKSYAFNYIFLDESQNIKNPETQRYKTVRQLQSRNKIAITGTPVENDTFDLYSQFSFACPGLLGSKQYFKEIFSTPVDRLKDSRRTQELQKRISPFLLRRTKQQVAKELPEKIEMVLYCDMKEEQRKVYDAYEKEFRDYISATGNEELKKNPMNVLKGLTKLRQICNSTRLLGSNEISGKGDSAKIEMLIEQVEDHAPHHKMLIFSQFVSMLNIIGQTLTERGIGFVSLTGSTKNRETVVSKFQNYPEIRVFLISLKAGGTGLNLTEADYVYLVDPWWNPAVENQAIDRTHRIGQTKNVTAIRLICPGTVEEKIMKMQASKKDLARELVSGDQRFISTLTKDKLLDLLEKTK